MTFPLTALAPKVELQNVVTAGVWTDITNYVYTRGGIEVTRGRQDESSSPEPSKCRLVLNNRDGRFSPRNPSGAYYGSIGRNTPMRLSVQLGQQRLVGPGSPSTSDKAAISITGDIDLRVDARLPAWDPNQVLISKYPGGGQNSYRVFMNNLGAVALQWSTDGTASVLATSTALVPNMTGRQAVRATLDVNNGAGGWTATFYTAATAAGPWTQLGDPVIGVGVTSIFDSTALLQVPALAGWEIYSVEVRNGIGGALVANPVFTSQAEGATSFSDGLGNTWSAPAGSITNRRYRFTGEVSSWPVEWDLSGKDVWASIEGSGIRRRLTQGASPLRSPFYRAVGALASVKAYWPVEDIAGATRIAAGLTGVATMAITGAPNLASDTTFAASAPLPTMNNSSFFAPVPVHAATGEVQVRLLTKLTAATVAGAVIVRVFTSGSLSRYDVIYAAGVGGDLILAWYDGAGALVGSTGTIDFNIDNDPIRLSVEMTQVGGDVSVGIGTLVPGSITGLASVPVVVPGRTVGYCTGVQIGPTLELVDEPVGHITVQSEVTDIYDVTAVLDAYAEERAGDRVQRLCNEQGVTLSLVGDTSDTEKMGAQKIATFATLVDQCADSDLGIVGERRDVFGISFRPRSTIYSQQPTLTLAYTGLDDLRPVDDDQKVRNDITVQRIDGSSARATLDSGPLSVLAPPAGVGRYDEQIDVSLFEDAQIPAQASWRLMQGTIDEPRYPTISLNLATGGATGGFASSAALTSAALDLDQGDLLVITGPPAWLPPDSIRQIAQGFVERIGPFEYTIEVNCTPASAWDVGVYDQGLPPTRYDSDGATLNAGITSTATGPAALSLVTPAGKPLWTSSAGEFPLNIEVGGELITLSAIAATASPQSATVSARSVNGVVKAHLAGAAVQVADFSVYAL